MESEADAEPEADTESDSEMIPEIRPKRRGPTWKRKPEIIPERRPPNKYTHPYQQDTDKDNHPTLQQWTDSEEERHDQKNDSLDMPRMNQDIKMWKTYGEKFTGRVIKLGKGQFKIREHETSAKIWIELEKLNFWDYLDEDKICPKFNRSDGNPSLIALRTI